MYDFFTFAFLYISFSMTDIIRCGTATSKKHNVSLFRITYEGIVHLIDHMCYLHNSTDMAVDMCYHVIHVCNLPQRQ